MFAKLRNGNGRKGNQKHHFQIGERVRANHKLGVVRAYSPEGTVLVRFDGQEKSRRVFPTFLEPTAR